jgi:hypothetical protein
MERSHGDFKRIKKTAGERQFEKITAHLAYRLRPDFFQRVELAGANEDFQGVSGQGRFFI